MWLTIISISISTLSAFFSLKSKSWDETKKGVLKFTKSGWILFILLVSGTAISISSVIISERDKNVALNNVKKMKTIVYSEIEEVCKDIAMNHVMFYKMNTHLLDTMKHLCPNDCLLCTKLSELEIDNLFSNSLSNFNPGYIYYQDSIFFRKLYNLSNHYQSYIDAKDFYIIEQLRASEFPTAFGIVSRRPTGLPYSLYIKPSDIKTYGIKFFTDLAALWNDCIFNQKS